MDKEIRILMLEDSPADAELEERELGKSGSVFILKIVDTKEAFLKELDEFSPDLILADYDLPTFNGLEALEIVKGKCPDVPFILVTGRVGEEFAIETLKKGATDYVLKNNLKRLAPSVKRAFEEAEHMAEHKRAEEQIKKANESLRLAMEASNSGTWDWDIVNNTFEWSPQFLIIFGMPPETIAGFEAWKNSLHPEDREIAAKKIQDSINDKTELINDYRIILPNQEIRWIRAIGKTLYNEHKPVRMTGLCLDITAHKQAEKTLQSITTRLETLIQVAPLAILVRDKNGNIQLWNKAAEQIFGWTAEEAIGHPVPIIPAEKQDEHKAWVSQIMQGKPLINQEAIRQRKDGSLINVSISSALMFGTHGDSITIIADITERKYAETALKNKIDYIESSDKKFIGSEMRMIELRKEVNALLEKLGQPKKYM